MPLPRADQPRVPAPALVASNRPTASHQHEAGPGLRGQRRREARGRAGGRELPRARDAEARWRRGRLEQRAPDAAAGAQSPRRPARGAREPAALYGRRALARDRRAERGAARAIPRGPRAAQLPIAALQAPPPARDAARVGEGVPEPDAVAHEPDAVDH